jgi:acyl-CoA reductase-like NAD-dependent aldehyde dehydrogenase
MNMIGEALAAQGETFEDFEQALARGDCEKLKAYLERKFPRFRKLPVTQVQSALRYIRALRMDERRDYYFEWSTNAKCNNDASPRD